MSRPLLRDVSGLDPSVVARIDDRLAGVRTVEGVAIPWAIESGSRAWGFPSPDSDYDCRFLYVRPVDAYLTPWRPRDVVETPLDSVLDVSGWDVVKAVQLAVGGNATVGEWLRSPLVYGGDPDFRDRVLALCDEVADPVRIGRHYLHVGLNSWQRTGAGHGQPVPLKRALYALRPAAVLHWMAMHGAPTPPMDLPRLLAEAPVPEAVREAVDALVAAKATTRELGTGVLDPALVGWIDDQLAAAATAYADVPAPREGVRDAADEAFREVLERWAPPPPA